ncbi:hypothetical protein BTE54_06930 [Agrobacterium sp. YIC 4121]|nr:hypothetical protein BTE54_06930 [Agrobacterium sp. YIC 4121]
MGLGKVFHCLRSAALPPSALPGISPSRGEIDLRQGLAHLEAWNEATKGTLADLPPLEGEMSGRTEGGKAPRTFGPLPTQNLLEVHLKLAVILRRTASILILP